MANENTFTLKVYSPAGLVLEDDVTEITIPSSNGEVGILPQHAKYTNLLGTGVLSYQSAESDKIVRIVVSEGFASYADSTLTILADAADRLDSVDEQVYAARRSEFTEIVDSVSSEDPKWKFAKSQLSRIEAIDQLISH